MITPIHIGFNLIIYFFVSKIYSFEMQLGVVLLLLAAELIDLDHFFSRPIINMKRNSFKTHFLHKQWGMVLVVAILSLFTSFYVVGLGLISHFLLDGVDVLIKRK